MATTRTNIKEFRDKIKAYGKRLTDEGIERAAVDLSLRAANAVKRDFTVFFDQSVTLDTGKGRTVRTAGLRSKVEAVVKSKTSFGVTTGNSPYGAVHEFGHPPYPITPKRGKFLKIPTAFSTGIKGQRKGEATNFIFLKKVMHPGQKARHWVSIPMMSELNAYIDDQIKKLEAPL